MRPIEKFGPRLVADVLQGRKRWAIAVAGVHRGASQLLHPLPVVCPRLAGHARACERTAEPPAGDVALALSRGRVARHTLSFLEGGAGSLRAREGTRRGWQRRAGEAARRG